MSERGEVMSLRGEEELGIWHGSGGFAPVGTSIVVTTEGGLAYDPPRVRSRCTSLSREARARLRSLVGAERLAAQFVTAERRARGSGELEDVSIWTPELSAQVPLEIAPPELLEILDLVEIDPRRQLGVEPPWETSE